MKKSQQKIVGKTSKDSMKYQGEREVLRKQESNEKQWKLQNSSYTESSLHWHSFSGALYCSERGFVKKNWIRAVPYCILQTAVITKL